MSMLQRYGALDRFWCCAQTAVKTVAAWRLRASQTCGVLQRARGAAPDWC